MIPVSANTEEGMPELLMVLTGLAQKYLEEKLKISEETEGKATILEVQEDPGVGTTLDIILYDGQIKKGDQILIGTLNEPILTKVRGLFEPEGKKLKNVEKIHAAYGVRVSAPDLKGAIGGMPLIVANTNVEEKKHALQTEIESVMINTDNEGVVVKADTLGSLEALTALLQLEGISIKKASIGNITKKDLAEASAEINDINKVILGFNVKTTETDEKVKIISDGVVYKIIEDYQNWKKAEEKKEEQQKLDELTRPVKVKILKGCIFRQSGPCVVGVVVEGGMLKTGTRLIKADGSKAEYIKSIQHEQKTVNQIEQGKEVAVSIPNITAGRQIKEEDTLYSNLSETEFRKLKEMKDLLRKDEIEVLKEIAKIKRRDKPSWGI